MKSIIWKLTAGRGIGQETEKQKLALGLEYIEKLKAEGENVTEVINEGDRLVIIIEE